MTRNLTEVALKEGETILNALDRWMVPLNRMGMSADFADLLIRTLERRDHLPEHERAALRSLSWRVRHFAPDEDIVAEASEPAESCLLVEGFACRANGFSDGRRQISALHVPGDFVDLHSLLLAAMDHSVTALTPCKVAFVRHEALRQISETSPHLARMLWMLSVNDAAILRNWIACMGRRSSEAHLAHVICEMFLRLQVVGLTEGASFELPISQLTMADVLGLSLVHVNRMLQNLRATGFVSWNKHIVTIHDWNGLAALAEFDPTYLNLRGVPK
jgi:CRP-like cAMP-binding protein